LEKFERISKKIVKVLARLAPLGSQGERGAFTLSLSNVPIYPEPVEGPAALPLFFSRAIFSLASLEKVKRL